MLLVIVARFKFNVLWCYAGVGLPDLGWDRSRLTNNMPDVLSFYQVMIQFFILFILNENHELIFQDVGRIVL